MKIKKLLALALVLAMVISMVILPANAVNLSDISDHWAKDSIQRWVDAGIINGYQDGTFKPNGNITRGEFATILSKAFGLSGKSDKTFSDVSGHWAEKYVYACAAAGIVGGYPDGTFLPDKAITRQEAMKMYTVALQLSAYVESDKYSEYLSDWFADAGEIGDWAKEYAVAMVVNNAMQGSVQGDSLMIRPTANISRAEVAVILDRLMAIYVNAENAVSTTSQGQVDAGMMGDRFVVHADAEASIKGLSEGGFEVVTDSDSCQLTGIKYGYVVYKGECEGFWYDDGGCEIADGQVIRNYRHSLPISSSVVVHNTLGDGTVETTETSTEYVYDEETWNLTSVLRYENGELAYTVSRELNENDQTTSVTVNDVVRKTFEYDEKGNVIKELNYDEEGEESRRTEYIYDTDGRLEMELHTWIHWYEEYQYDENGEPILDDDGNHVFELVKEESSEYTKYTYDDMGRMVASQTYAEGDFLENQTTISYDDKGDVASEISKNYSRYYTGEDEFISYVSYERRYSYENGYQKEHESIQYNREGVVRSHTKDVSYRDEDGRQSKREYFELNVETGELGLVYTEHYVYSDEESWRLKERYQIDAAGQEVHKYTYEYIELEGGYTEKTYYYEFGELVSWSEYKDSYETNEWWETEYDKDENVIYKYYGYGKETDEGRTTHYEYEYAHGRKEVNDYEYIYVMLPENYSGNNWDYYYFY